MCLSGNETMKTRPVYEMPHKCNSMLARACTLLCVCVGGGDGSRILNTELKDFSHVNLEDMRTCVRPTS